MADSEESFRRAFGLLAFAMNRHLAQHMRRVSRALDADLESVFVWATLAHLNAMNIALPGMDPLEAPTIGDAMLQALHPVRLTDVVQVTGLPRETVRRKLERLSAMGKVERNPDGRWVYRGTGVSDAEVEFTRKTVLKFLGTAQTLLTVLDQVKVNPEPSENGATQAI